MTSVVYASPKEPQATSALFQSVGLHNRPVFAEWLSARDRQLLDRSSFWTGKEEILFSSDSDQKRATFDTYQRSQALAGPFLATAAAVGAPSYFGQDVNRASETVGLADPALLAIDKFFRTTDESYAKALDKYDFVGLRLSVKPFTHIVLSRASTRNEIPEAIADLRDTFAHPRKKLWSMFDDIQYERDSQRLLKQAEKLQAAAESIIPAAYRKGPNLLRLVLDTVAGATSLVGAAMPSLRALDDADRPQRQVNKVDAARLLSRELRADRDVLGLIQRHLAPSELRAVGL